MTALVVLTVLVIVALIAVLAIYLYWVGALLTRVADNLDEANERVSTIVGHAALIGPGVKHINESGVTVATALPLLYGLAEQIVAGVTHEPDASKRKWRVSTPASGQRPSRSTEAVGFDPSRE